MSRPTHWELDCASCRFGREVEIVELVCQDGIMRFYGKCITCNYKTPNDPTIEAVVWRWRKAWREYQEGLRGLANA